MKNDTFEALIHRHLDGAATPEEASRLALALLENPAAARAYAEATRLESGLRTCFQAEVVGRRLDESVPVRTGSRQGHSRGWLAAAAGLVVAGMSVAWWRPWARPGAGPSTVAEKRSTAPRTVTGPPAPPPSLRRPGALSPAAAEVKRLASRYWLPDRIEFAAAPLEDAVAAVQRQAGAVNHRRNGTIAGFAIDLPDEVAGVPVTASRANLPLGAWLELLSAQAGCELRYTESGVAFDRVEQPETMETRRFSLPTVAEAGGPDGSAERLFSYARPWDEEPDFRSAPAHGATLAAAWGIELPATARAKVKYGQMLEVRHTRAVLRRIEGLLAVAVADAGRPRVTMRAKDVALPVPSPTLASAVTWNDTAASVDDYSIDLTFSPEVVHFEGFIHYGSPLETTAIDANGQPQTVVLTESRIEQPVFATRPAAGNRVVSNEEAANLLGGALGQLFGSGAWTQVAGHRSDNFDTWFARGYANGLVDAGGSLQTTKELTRGRMQDHFDQVVRGAPATAEQPAPDPWASTVKATVGLGESAWLATGGAPPVVAGKGFAVVAGFSLMDLKPPPPLNTTARLEGEMVKLTGTYTPPGAGGAPTDFEAYVAEGQALVLQTEDAPEVPSSGGVVTWDVDAGVARLSDEVSERYMLTQAGEAVTEAGVPTAFEVGVVNSSDEYVVEYDPSREGETVVEAGAPIAGSVGVANGVVGFVESESGGQVADSLSLVMNGRLNDMNWSFRPQTSAAIVLRGVVISPVLEWPVVSPK